MKTKHGKKYFVCLPEPLRRPGAATKKPTVCGAGGVTSLHTRRRSASLSDHHDQTSDPVPLSTDLRDVIARYFYFSIRLQLAAFSTKWRDDASGPPHDGLSFPEKRTIRRDCGFRRPKTDGVGSAHQCLARREMRIGFEHVLNTVKRMQLDPAKAPVPHVGGSTNEHGWDELHVLIEPERE